MEALMTELEKLKHLLEHWIEHNRDHVRTYEQWASKAESLNEKELSGILREIAEESRKIEGLFKRALESIQEE
jgi:rubrerythrin